MLEDQENTDTIHFKLNNIYQGVLLQNMFCFRKHVLQRSRGWRKQDGL